MLEFLCPHGHKIRCPAEQAGRAAKCPRCGVKFRIPEVGELDLSVTSDSTGPAAQLSDSAVSAASASRADTADRAPTAEKERQIEFLCPKGHHLHGPASLQGRPGECPECGSRFRIPIVEEPTLDSTASEEIDLSVPSADGASGKTAGSKPSVEGKPATADHAQASSPVTAADSSTLLPKQAAGQLHPLGEMFARLWAGKAPEARVELYLTGSPNLVPDQFDVENSRQSYGVFTVHGPDDRKMLVVVAWDAVQQIRIHGMAQLPAERGST